MKRIIVICLLALTAAYGCQVNELVEVDSESKSFTASIEDNCTKTSLDDQGNVRWKQGDQVSIFVGSTINEQYQVTDDSDGKTSASIVKVTGSGFVGGGEIDNNVAFYPYAATAEIARSGDAFVISDISLPATQTYAAGSFGNGAFPMAAVTSSAEDMHLKFKNVLGGVKLQLTGTAVVKSVSISGNGNEILCGAAEVTVSNTSTPAISLTDASAKTVTLGCGDGVQLNSETATSFIIALPPMTMEGGFTVVVTDTEGKQMEIKTTKPQTINRTTLLKMPEVAYEGTLGPLTFTSTGETSISLVKEGDPDDVSLEYNKNGGAWIAYSVGDVIALADGEKVSFRAGAMANTSFGKSLDDYHHFAISGKGRVAASGSIMSILDQEESAAIQSSYCFFSLFRGCNTLTSAAVLPATVLTDNCYCEMFYGCTSLTSAPDLPATTLADYCYCGMFSGCTSLTSAPTLPAMALAYYCYGSMFSGCSGLTEAPDLPATTLAGQCYSNMFSGCTSLTAAPDLPATTLADYCYGFMFLDCSGLTAAPDLPATTLADYCYCGMFKGCTSLTSAPALPTTTLAHSCYGYMFSDCTSLTTAPELPATSLANFCYQYMFSGCTSLTIASGLPATTLAGYCYSGMFSGCTSLTSAPKLPATSLAAGCYYMMFKGCSNLNYIKCLATDLSANSCLFSWVDGVSSNGVFIKDPDTTWPIGNNGIPEGWTVYPTGLPAEAEAVDLGLSVKWASFNLGASSPKEYGAYFAWGETEPKPWGYNWVSYKWCNGEYNKLTKYCPTNKADYWDGAGTPDGKTVLDLEDDAARANWGGTWRMPTDAEWTELRTNCTWTWTTQNGVNGRLVTASNGNSIFLPAAGGRSDTSLDYVGSYGIYWSSSLNTDRPDRAWYVLFFSSNVGRISYYRCIGRSVRPVCD